MKPTAKRPTPEAYTAAGIGVTVAVALIVAALAVVLIVRWAQRF